MIDLGDKVQILLSDPRLNCELIAHVPAAQSAFVREQAVIAYLTRANVMRLT
ncbi:hypothetical protein [Sinorhizobium sp. BJ1]|uniref:hypothetical protein n=1 Tax=Sinorhizobium sp. BJ1 TaxID=2035455 RepID=UPI0015CF0748|nr:hypothetical protein [Sinorhizobium sp. BJ1]